jgi:hypothetical protein
MRAGDVRELGRLARAAPLPADPADVRRVLELFALAVAGQPIPPRVVTFVAESFGRYLGHKRFYGPAARSGRGL